MSIFGEPLPHEDDTATSLIRREGYPPLGSYDQMPQVYVCPCCSAINPNHDHDRLLRTAKEEKEMERRRLMQLDIFDERARPLVSESAHSRKVTNYRGPEEELQSQALVPPPPMTLDELRKMRGEANKTRLIVTVHQGKNINVHPRNPTSVLVHCGSFEGQTAKIPRGTETTCTWEELFEFPYPSEDEPLEILVIDDTLPAEQDHILGGVVVPPYALRNRARGDEEVIPICPQDEMHRGYGRMRETPMGSLLVSWYLKHDGEEADPADGKQNLESPVNCVFIVHRIFQYTDSGAVPFESGVLCVLRDTDDNCSASTECHASGVAAMSTSPYYTNEGYNYLPEPPSQTMQLITEKRLGHVLVCVPKGDGDEEEAEELLVVGAVPLDFGELYHKGSAVLLIESKVKEDVLWGEVALEWRLTPHENIRKELEELQEAEKTKLENEALKNGTLVINESLFVTVARGLRLKDRDGVPLSQAQVSLFAGDMEGSTFVAPSTMDEDGETNVITWNQEVRFMDMEKGQSVINVHVLDNNERVSSGSFELEKDHGYAVVKVFDPYDEEKDLGEILVAYNRVRTTTQVAKSLLNEQQDNTDERTNSQGQPGLLSEERDRSMKSRDNQCYNGEGTDGLEREELSNGLHGEEGEDGSQVRRMANEGDYPVEELPGSKTSSKQQRSPQELHGEEGEDGSQARRMASEGDYPVEELPGSKTSSKQQRSPQELHGEEGEDGSQARRMASEGDYPADDKGRMSQWEHSVGEGEHGAEQDGSGKQRISQQRGKADDKAGSESKRPRSVKPTFDDNKSKTPFGASATTGAASVAGSDRIPGVPGQKTRVGSGHGVGTPSRRDNSGGPKTPAVQQPWFPARSTGNEDHIPLDKRESFLNRADAIRDLERRSRISGQSGDRRLSRPDPTRD